MDPGRVTNEFLFQLTQVMSFACGYVPTFGNLKHNLYESIIIRGYHGKLQISREIANYEIRDEDFGAAQYSCP